MGGDAGGCGARRKKTMRRKQRKQRGGKGRMSRKAMRTKKPKKGTKKKGKKKMNAYMLALNKARKAKAKSFVYKGKTYYQKFTKTGMAIYSSKK